MSIFKLDVNRIHNFKILQKLITTTSSYTLIHYQIHPFFTTIYKNYSVNFLIKSSSKC